MIHVIHLHIDHKPNQTVTQQDTDREVRKNRLFVQSLVSECSYLQRNRSFDIILPKAQ